MPRNILLGRAHRWPGACDDFHRITLVGAGWKAAFERTGQANNIRKLRNETNGQISKRTRARCTSQRELRNEPSDITEGNRAELRNEPRRLSGAGSIQSYISH